MADQTENAFQKQEAISIGGRASKAFKSSRKGKNLRWYKNIGLGFKTPKEAIEGNYVDKKCPFTSDVSIRGRIMTGIVKSTKMNRTVTVRRDYLHYIKKYNRYEKRHAMTPAHCSPAWIGLKVGDQVTIGQCRPLSKTVRFNVIRVDKQSQGGKQFGGM